MEPIKYFSNKERVSKKQAEAIQKEKMAFLESLASSINHEIANPLSIARGQCEAFLVSFKEGLYKDKQPAELLERTVGIMERVVEETDRITDITRRLTDFVKPGKELKYEEINISDEIDTVLTFLNSEIKLFDIELTKNISKGLPNILADKKHIQQILFNIIKNAVQALADIRKIKIDAAKNGAYIKIIIEDSGSGIKEDDLKSIFLPFFTTKKDGTGLGLFIVKQLVEKNKGKIEIKSKAKEGTSVFLYFPAIKH